MANIKSIRRSWLISKQATRWVSRRNQRKRGRAQEIHRRRKTISEIAIQIIEEGTRNEPDFSCAHSNHFTLSAAAFASSSRALSG